MRIPIERDLASGASPLLGRRSIEFIAALRQKITPRGDFPPMAPQQRPSDSKPIPRLFRGDRRGSNGTPRNGNCNSRSSRTTDVNGNRAQGISDGGGRTDEVQKRATAIAYGYAENIESEVDWACAQCSSVFQQLDLLKDHQNLICVGCEGVIKLDRLLESSAAACNDATEVAALFLLSSRNLPSEYSSESFFKLLWKEIRKNEANSATTATTGGTSQPSAQNPQNLTPQQQNPHSLTHSPSAGSPSSTESLATTAVQQHTLSNRGLKSAAGDASSPHKVLASSRDKLLLSKTFSSATAPSGYCVYCGLYFTDKTLYLLHKGMHSEYDPWRCNLCGYRCANKYTFTSHIISSDHN